MNLINIGKKLSNTINFKGLQTFSKIEKLSSFCLKPTALSDQNAD
jgi:hypothetical protein